VTLSQDRSDFHERNKVLLDQLDLTPTQREKLDRLHIKYQDLFVTNAKTTKDRAERVQRRKILQQDLRMEMREILTPSQMRALREKVQETNRLNESGVLVETLALLNLNDVQKDEIRELLMEQRPKINQLKASDLSPEDKRIQIRQIRASTMASLNEILNEEQFETLQSQIKSRLKGENGSDIEID
jgi:Spy/CpxP family protein refolding chaperone